jgi:benzodiazapine receptor
MDLSRDDLPGLALAVVICNAVGASPALLTAGTVETWYETITQPALAPPNWVFGPVWTLLFTLLGVAVYLVLRHGGGRARTLALALFVGQYAFNVAWTLVFFGDQNIAGGLAVILVLLALIAATLGAFWRVRKEAGLLLVPYLLWVAFATYLNYAFWVLN